MNTLRTPMTPMFSGSKDADKYTAAERRPHQDCRSVLVSHEAFDWLREFQAGTNPRLELRYLLEAAVDLVRAQPALATQLERQARDRLKRHLVSLD